MSQRILIVDDDVDFVYLLSTRLMANNYEVSTAYDAMTAVSIAQEKRPHLIILDIRLPGGGGFKVYENLRTSLRTSRIPVLFITGFDEVGPEQERKVKDSLQALNYPFLIKPFVVDTLLEKIKQALKQPPAIPDENEKALVKEIIAWVAGKEI
ncbi:MAG: response regulator [bacterium]|jgi:DNA-binding response OmpR family regulator